ncbi:uncharacterized protein LOC141599679 [Silene latifolia]|uniref:uncharacterized protein LOC141599679 n=1 Tax=Silene latifolia TaxID=37657 RepID=UPI003D782937
MRIRMRILSSSSKPISSPGRTEKFPPPLMRFLRSDVSSRSRGRSKASPLFFRRKKSITTTSTGIEATQEPSSPKVTCIGQVRVRRSKINANKKRKSKNNRPKQRNYFNYIPSLCNFKGCYSPKWNCTWRWRWRWRWSWCWRWVLCFECFDCRRNGRRVRTASSSRNGGSSSRFEEGKERRQEEQQEHGGRVIRGFGMRQFDDGDGDEDDGFDRGRRSSVSEISGTTPPRNAFLLTRSRSSSLASRFWGEEELVEETRRRSSASEMGPTMCITPPKNALLLTRSRSSSLGNRFAGEEEVEEIRRRSSASEMRTVISTTPPKNALVLTRFLGEGGGEDVTRRRSSASEMRTNSATTPPKNALVLTRSRSSSLGNRFCSQEGVEEVIRRKSSASEMRTLASRFWVEKEEEETTSRAPGQEMRTLPSRFWVEKEEEETTSRRSASEMRTKVPKNSLLTRSRSLASRFWGEKKEEEETRRKSSASEMSTQSKTASLLTRCRSSSLARRFWGEKEETKRRRSVSERSTASQTENAVVLTRCKSSSLAEIMLLKNRDLTAETRGNEGSNFSISEESKKNVGVCAEKDGEHGGACFSELLPSVGVKSNGDVNKVGGKNEERGFKLRRCKSEPARPDLPDSDSEPKNNESLRLGRFSNVETATYRLNNNNNNN